MKIDRDQLVNEILAAFDRVRRESGISLHQANAMDCNWSKPESELCARAIDSDDHWKDVPVEWLERFSSAFDFMDAKGLRYYLPAVMVWDIKANPESPSPDNVSWLLQRRVSRADELRSILSMPQRQVVARWLAYRSQFTYKPNEVLTQLKTTPWWDDLGKGEGIDRDPSSR